MSISPRAHCFNINIITFGPHLDIAGPSSQSIVIGQEKLSSGKSDVSLGETKYLKLTRARAKILYEIVR